MPERASPWRRAPTRPGRLPALLLLVTGVGCVPGGAPAGDGEPDAWLATRAWQAASHWPLPPPLREVSGLAHLSGDAAATNRWLAHDDNSSRLWVVTTRPGQAPGITAAGGQAAPVHGDFEGVAVADGQLYLLASPGRLLRAPLDTTTGALTGPLTPVTSGIEGRCNFEGLVALDPQQLYLACKYRHEPTPPAHTILLFRMRLGGAAPLARAVPVDVSTVLSATGLERLRPSGLAWLPEQRRLLVLAGKERVLLEVDGAGVLRAWRRLARGLHRQAEGVSVSADGLLAIVDEADGRRPTLTVYGDARPRAPP